MKKFIMTKDTKVLDENNILDILSKNLNVDRSNIKLSANTDSKKFPEYEIIAYVNYNNTPN